MRGNFQAKRTTLTVLAQISPKIDFWLQIQKTNAGIRISISRYHLRQFSSKKDNFDFFGPNLPKNGSWGRNFKNLCLDWKSTPPIHHVCQFSVKVDNFKFFGLNLGKLPNYTCDILVLITLRVLQRAQWRLK